MQLLSKKHECTTTLTPKSIYQLELSVVQRVLSKPFLSLALSFVSSKIFVEICVRDAVSGAKNSVVSKTRVSFTPHGANSTVGEDSPVTSQLDAL